MVVAGRKAVTASLFSDINHHASWAFLNLAWGKGATEGTPEVQKYVKGYSFMRKVRWLNAALT
jgi:hypothetical protein